MKIRLLTLLCCLLTPWLHLAQGQSTESRAYFIQHAANKFFDLPLSAKSVSMGRAFSPVSRDVWSVYENPAGLADAKRPSLTAQYMYDELNGEDYLGPSCPPFSSDIEENLHEGSILTSYPIRETKYGVLGFGASGRFSDVDDTYHTDTERWTVTAAYGLKLASNLNAGYAVSYRNDSEDNRYVHYRMEDGIRQDIGLQWIPEETWIAGIHGYYGFGSIDSRIAGAGSQNGDRDAFGVEAGIAKSFPAGTTLVFAVRYDDYDLDAAVNRPLPIQNVDETGHTWSFLAGVEQAITDRFSIRGGVWLSRNRLQVPGCWAYD